MQGNTIVILTQAVTSTATSPLSANVSQTSYAGKPRFPGLMRNWIVNPGCITSRVASQDKRKLFHEGRTRCMLIATP